MAKDVQRIILRGETQRAFALRFISELSIDKLWAVEIKPHRPKRTLDQSAMFHGHCAIIANVTGNSPEDVKDALKQMFLPARFVDMDGTMVEVRRSTAALNTKEMADLCSHVMAWAATELGIVLPTRDDDREVV